MRWRAFVVALLTSSGSAYAHDFWIEPARFHADAGSVLSLHLRVGDHGHGEPVARNPNRLSSFVLVDGEGSRPVPGRDGADPAGVVRLGSGASVIGYRSHPAFIELEANAFEAYLREEGLERILELRRELGEADAPGRERYSRCAKAIVQAGDGLTGHDAVLGLPLELVPAVHPAAAARVSG